MWKPTFVVVLNGIFFYSQRNLKSKSLTLNALQFFFIILFQWPHPLPKQSLVDLFYTPSHPPPDFAHTPLPKLLSLLMQYPRSATPFSTRNFVRTLDRKMLGLDEKQEKLSHFRLSCVIYTPTYITTFFMCVSYISQFYYGCIL